MAHRAMHKTFLLILAFWSVQNFTASGQSNLLFYHTHEQFNSPLYNPAFSTRLPKFTLSFFPIGGMDISYNDPSLINKMIFKTIKGDSLNQSSKDVFNGLVKKGLFYQNFETALLTFGYNNPDLGAFDFRIREVERFQNNFRGDLTRFLTDPEPQTIFIGNPQHIPAQLLHYREYSLSYAREIVKDKLIVGIRGKIYFGKSSFLSDLSVNTGIQENAFNITTAGFLHISAPVKVVLENKILQPFQLQDNFSATKYLTNSKNTGSGIDLGLVFKINEQTELSASVTDLGKINWKSNLNTVNYQGNYVFPSAYIQSASAVSVTKTPGFTAQTNNNFDLFAVDTTKQDAFATRLPATFYLGLNYQANARLAIGVTDRYIYLKELSQNTLALLTSYTLNNRLKINSGFALIGNSFFNVPLGIVYQWKRGQTYIGSDNIFSLLVPSVSNFAGITFGTCFYPFREKDNYEQNKYLPFYKERKSRRMKSGGLLR